jgi:site-specific DNA-methyltransferase (adenine-specific)
MPERTRQLYYGDCLDVMRRHLPDAWVDLVYLDPPFNSKATYNVLFKPPEELGEAAQIRAFEDTWHWTVQTEREYAEILKNPYGNTDLAKLVSALRQFLGENDMMAYLVHMANRLLEIRRVMRDTASIYLHCDPTASHYLKLVMDAVFGARQFRNEIIWAYRGAGVPKRDFARRHDVIFRYSKTNKYALYVDAVRMEYAEATKERFAHYIGNIRRTGDYGQQKLHPKGKHPDDWWQIQPIAPSAKERLSYPTQKPMTLLERIILASSKEGDVVFDPFCGCGTTVHVAEHLKRDWIGIDITHIAITLIRGRLHEAFGDLNVETHGLPASYAGALELARVDKHEFELWVLGELDAMPYKGGRRGADTGIDGYLFFRYLDEARGGTKEEARDGTKEEARGLSPLSTPSPSPLSKPVVRDGKAIVEVKGGGTNVKDVRNLDAVVEREGADLGVLVSALKPSGKMYEHAAGRGTVTLGTKDYPRLQVIWLKDLMEGRARVEYPESGKIEHTKQAPRFKKDYQEELE